MTQKTLKLSVALFILVIGVILTGLKPGLKVSSRHSISVYSSYVPRERSVDDDGLVSPIQAAQVEEKGLRFTERTVGAGANNSKEELRNQRLILEPEDRGDTDEAGQEANLDRKGPNAERATYVIYINWDGFAYRYYEWANAPGAPGTPALNYLASRGAVFTNAYNGFPGTTVPMQTSIVTGAWPAVHGNIHVYYDLVENVVKQMNRENLSETIGEVVAERGLSSASVQQFALNGRGTWHDNPRHLYVQPSGPWHTRVAEAIRILKQEEVAAGNGQKVIVPEIPRFLAIYADDLDATGHNLGIGYGFSLALSYEAWKENLIKKLAYMDSGLGLLIDALRELGILDRTAIILTSDHGMSHFEGKTSLPDVLETLSTLGYTVQVLSQGEKASPNTAIVLVGGNLSLQFYFRREIALDEYKGIIKALEEKPYFGGYMSMDELAKAGAHPDFGSLYIWAKPPFHFSDRDLFLRVGGNHNSGDLSSRHVFMLFSGAGIRQGIIVEEPVAIIDVSPTISYLLDVRQPADSQGRILEEAIARHR